MRNLILIIAVVTSYLVLRGWSGAPPLLLRSGIAVAVLLAGFVLRSKPQLLGIPRMQAARKPGVMDYLVLAAGLLIAELGLLFLTATLAQPLENAALDAHDYLRGSSSVVKKQHEGNDPEFDGHVSGNWLFKPDLRRGLPQNSNHKPTNKPEIFIELESRTDALALHKSRVHLRAFAFEKFDGKSWSIARRENTALPAPVKLGTPASLISFRYKVYQPYNPSGQNVLTALHGCTLAEVGPLTKLGDALFLLPPPSNRLSGYTYTVTSSPLHFGDIDTQSLRVADDVEPATLEIPASLQEKLIPLREGITTSDEVSAQLHAIKNHLRGNYEYSLKTTNPDGIDPLENFLFQEQRGYCEHFAMAAAVLCRSFGIPSRIAYGWSGGKLFTAQQMFVFRAKDAHAWTEVHLKDHGWVVFDTTPPTAVPESTAAAENDVAPNVDEIFEQPEEETTTESGGQEMSIEPRVPAILLLLCLTVVLILLGMRFWKFRKEVSMEIGGVSQTMPYYLRFRAASASRGHPIPQGRTLRQHLRTLDEIGEAPPFAALLLDYHYGRVYGETDRNKEAELTLLTAIKQWATEREKVEPSHDQ